MMASLVQQVRYWLGLVGQPGLVGIALMVAAVALAASVVLPQQERIAKLEQDIERTRRAPPAIEIAPPETPEVKVEKFYRNLPQLTTTPDWLQKVFDAASINGVVLEQGEYILLSNPNAKLEEYRIIFPLKGAYPQLRKFTAAALEAVPALALESLLFKREKIADGSVDAKITFLLYLEEPDEAYAHAVAAAVGAGCRQPIGLVCSAGVQRRQGRCRACCASADREAAGAGDDNGSGCSTERVCARTSATARRENAGPVQASELVRAAATAATAEAIVNSAAAPAAAAGASIAVHVHGTLRRRREAGLPFDARRSGRDGSGG